MQDKRDDKSDPIAPAHSAEGNKCVQMNTVAHLFDKIQRELPEGLEVEVNEAGSICRLWHFKPSGHRAILTSALTWTLTEQEMWLRGVEDALFALQWAKEGK